MESRNIVQLAGVLSDVKVETTAQGKTIAKLIVDTDPPAWMTNVSAKDRTQVIVFGRTVAEAQKLKAGQFVAVTGRTRGREYNGRWSCDVIGEKFQVIGSTPVKQPQAAASADPDDLLF